MLKKGLLLVLVLLVLFLGFVATRPDRYRVERSATIAAPPERVFANLSDLRRWTAWSPWEARDPAMKRTYGGAESGRGATYAWDGNDQVGSGRMTVVESTPPSGLAIDLEFLTPFEGKARTRFDLKPAPNGTLVTWSMDGERDFVGKLVGTLFDVEGMIGKDYEQGLAALKRVSEAGDAR